MAYGLSKTAEKYHKINVFYSCMRILLGLAAHSLGVTFLSTMVKVNVCAGEDCGVEDGDDDDTVTVGGCGWWSGEGVGDRGGGGWGGCGATVAVC